jgi:HEAT repeat protein
MSVPEQDIDWDRIGSASTEALIAYLRQPGSIRTRDLRSEALRVLGRRRAPQAFALFTHLLAGQDGTESDLAAEALARLGDPAAVPHLERAYAEASRIVATTSICLGSQENRPIGMLTALTRLRSQDELATLLRAGDQPLVRVLAAMELGRRGDRSATDALEQAQSDPNEYVRGAAQEALKRLGNPDGGKEADEWGGW